MLFIVCHEAAESKLVKLETSCTVILPPTVSALWYWLLEFCCAGRSLQFECDFAKKEIVLIWLTTGNNKICEDTLKTLCFMTPHTDPHCEKDSGSALLQ